VTPRRSPSVTAIRRRNRTYNARIAAGLCKRCGAPRTHYKTYCNPCGLVQRHLMRIKTHSHAWKGKGAKGRPPMIPDGPTRTR
jgi:predicted amidophosphoribosyltransferase